MYNTCFQFHSYGDFEGVLANSVGSGLRRVGDSHENQGLKVQADLADVLAAGADLSGGAKGRTE